MRSLTSVIRLFIFTGFGLSLLFSTPSFGKEAQVGKKKKKIEATESKKSPEKTKTANDDAESSTSPKRYSSEEQRESKKFGIYGEIGLVDILQFGRGVRGAFLLDTNEHIELGVFSSEFSLFGYSVATTNAAIRYKRFFGNSFNVYGGGGLRQLTFSSPTVSGSDTLTSRSLAVETGIGNHWSFDNLSIGCDWVGLLIPVATLSSSDSFKSDKSAESIESDRNSFKKNSNSTDLMTVRFFLGAQF